MFADDERAVIKNAIGHITQSHVTQRLQTSVEGLEKSKKDMETCREKFRVYKKRAAVQIHEVEEELAKATADAEQHETATTEVFDDRDRLHDQHITLLDESVDHARELTKYQV